MRTDVHIRDGHDNSFTALRIGMALAVLIGHAMIIAARDLQAEPMIYGTYSLSYMAVNAFFVTSGFLVTASMMHRRSLREFAVARALRIMPALAVHVFLVMFVVGLWNTTLPAWTYLTHADTLSQPLRVLTFTDTNFILPGVFTDNHEAYASAPLWTLRYEVLAYLGTALAFAAGLLGSKKIIAAQFWAACLAWLAVETTGTHDALPATALLLLRFALPYTLGAMIWAYRDQLPFRLWLVPMIFIAAVVSADTAVAEISMNLTIAYALFYLAYLRSDTLASLSSGPDVSYGIYIWHWPILQWLAAKQHGMELAPMLLITVPVTVLLAWTSWHAVEKPALAKKAAVSDWLASKGRRRATV